MKHLKVLDFAKPVAYNKAYLHQKKIRDRLLHARKVGSKFPDHLFLLEHNPVFTLGRKSLVKDLFPRENYVQQLGLTKESLPNLANNTNLDESYLDKIRNTTGKDVFRVDRGGEITYHCPGQIVAYLLFDLAKPNHKKDLHVFLRDVEEVSIKTLAEYGIKGFREEAYTGVWINDTPPTRTKISAIGFSVSSWITMHGLSINVDCNMQGFGEIIPCGIQDEQRGVSVMRDQVKITPPMSDIKASIIKNVLNVFGFESSEIHKT